MEKNPQSTTAEVKKKTIWIFLSEENLIGLLVLLVYHASVSYKGKVKCCKTQCKQTKTIMQCVPN